MRINAKATAALATGLLMVSGGGVAWAADSCPGMGGGSSPMTTTGSTDPTTTTASTEPTTTTTSTTTTTAATSELARKHQIRRHAIRHVGRR